MGSIWYSRTILKIATKPWLSAAIATSLLMRMNLMIQQKIQKISVGVAMMTMMGLDLVKKVALMTYCTQREYGSLISLKDLCHVWKI